MLQQTDLLMCALNKGQNFTEEETMPSSKWTLQATG